MKTMAADPASHNLAENQSLTAPDFLRRFQGLAWGDEPLPRLFDKVERAKQEWEATADALPELVCLVDRAGKVIRANRTVERWHLAPITAVRGLDLHELLHAECQAPGCTLREALSQARARAGEGRLAEIETYDELNEQHLLIRARPVKARKGSGSSSTVFVIDDITERKEAEQALQLALKSRDQMVRNVSHELRTPLTMIRAYTELLTTSQLGALPAEQAEAVAIVARHAARLESMVTRLLQLQTIAAQDLDREPLDVGDWLAEIVESWAGAAVAGGYYVSVINELPADLPAIMADGQALAQAVTSLLDNALKFSAPGSEVLVRARAEGGWVLIAVSDEGIGIAPQELATVFECFYQIDGSTSRSYGGMGVGLTLCRAIIEAHGGRTWAESRGEGQGSTFYLALPRPEPQGHCSDRSEPMA